MKIFFFLFALPNISQNDGKFMKSVESYNSTEKGNTGHHVWSSFHLFIEGGKAWLGVVTQEAAIDLREEPRQVPTCLQEARGVDSKMFDSTEARISYGAGSSGDY